MKLKAFFVLAKSLSRCYWQCVALSIIKLRKLSLFFSQFPLQHPEIYLMAFVFSLTGYLGINFVLVLVRSFGALLAVTGLLTLHSF